MTGAKWIIDPALGSESLFLIFVVAIVVGTWFGGLGPVLFATRALGLGGRIEVESEPGAGTTVRFVAPLQNLRR